MENKWFKFLPKKNQWFIVLLIGVLLVIIAIPTKSDSQFDTGDMYKGTEIQTTNVEKKLEDILRKMEGVGEVSVMITFHEDETVEGIVVVAEGAGNAVVVREITGVVQALFDVDSHKIKVIERKQNQ